MLLLKSCLIKGKITAQQIRKLLKKNVMYFNNSHFKANIYTHLTPRISGIFYWLTGFILCFALKQRFSYLCFGSQLRFTRLAGGGLHTIKVTSLRKKRRDWPVISLHDALKLEDSNTCILFEYVSQPCTTKQKTRTFQNHIAV